MNSSQIISLLPYQKPFLFVDKLTHCDAESITGHYTFDKTAFFYKGHFKDNPITPGVILTECMAQIGLVCLGIYLLQDKLRETQTPKIALTSSTVDFYLPVYPGDKVTVVSDKDVFRFNKLKCNVKMLNDKNELVCRGKISGMISYGK